MSSNSDFDKEFDSRSQLQENNTEAPSSAKPSEAETFNTWCQKTTCHGFAEVAKSKKWERLFWTVMIVLSFTFFAEEIFTNIYTYFGDDQWVSSTFDGFHDYLVFPSVLICSFNRFNVTRAEKKWNLTERHMNYMNNYFKYFQNDLMDFDDSILSLDQQRLKFLEWKKNLSNNVSFQDLVFDLGHSCEQTIQFAMYEDKYIADPCKHVINFGIPQFGKCLLFKLPNGSRKVYYPGTTSSLNLLLDTNSEDYQTTIQNNFWDVGFAVFLFYELENKETGLPKLVYDDTFVSVAPGYHSWIALHLHREVVAVDKDQNFIGSMIHPHPCVSDGEIQILSTFAYSNLVCAVDCSYKLSYDHCGCIPFYNSSSYNMCEPDVLYTCFQNVSKKVVGSSDSSEDTLDIITAASEPCINKCTHPCDNYHYETQVSLSKFPSPKQLDRVTNLFLKKKGVNLTKQHIIENFVAVDIFYDSIRVTTTMWRPKITFSQLLSSVGGDLGLCAGISILTIIQAVWFFGQGLKNVIKRKLIKKQNAVSNK